MMNEKTYEKMHTNSGKVSIVGMGDEIRAARAKHKVTMIKAAIYCGVSENTFFRWEHGATKSISEDCYNKLVDILNGDYCA